MALAQWSEMSILKELKDCLEGGEGRYQPGPAMVNALASIATRLGQNVIRNSWIGPGIALLSESLEVNEVDKILAERPGRNQTEWAKWDLTRIDYAWGNTASKDGRDKIRDLIYNLLMEDLKRLYTGYTDDNGSEIRGMDPKAICARIKTDIGFVLKSTYLREKLIFWGVPVRDQSGRAFVRGRSQTESVGSPSTIGPSTPSSSTNTVFSALPVLTVRKSAENLVTATHLQSVSQMDAPRIFASEPASSTGYSIHSNAVPWRHPNDIEHDENLNEQAETLDIYDLTFAVPEHNSFLNTFNDLADSMDQSVFETDFSQTVPDTTSFAPGHRKGVPSDLSMKDLPETSIHSDVTDISSTKNKLNGASPRSQPKVTASSPISNSAHSSMLPPVIDTNMSYSNNILIQLVEKVGVLTERLDAERTARIKLETKVAESYAHIGQCTPAYVALGNDYQQLSLDFLDISQRLERLEKLYTAAQSDGDREREARDALEIRHYALDDQLKKLQTTTGDLISRTNNMEFHNQLTKFTTTSLEMTLNELGANFETLCSHGWTIKTGLDTVKLRQDTLETAFGTAQGRNTEVEEKLIELENKHVSLQNNLDATRQQTIVLEKKTQVLEENASIIEDKNGKLQCSMQALHNKNDAFQETITVIQNSENVLHEQMASFQSEHADLRNKVKKAEDRFSVSSLDSGLGRSPRNSIEGLPGSEPTPMPKRQWSDTSSTGQIDKKRVCVHDGTETSIDLAGQGEGAESPVLGPYHISFRSETNSSEISAENNFEPSFLEVEVISHLSGEPFVI